MPAETGDTYIYKKIYIYIFIHTRVYIYIHVVLLQCYREPQMFLHGCQVLHVRCVTLMASPVLLCPLQ